MLLSGEVAMKSRIKPSIQFQPTIDSGISGAYPLM